MIHVIDCYYVDPAGLDYTVLRKKTGNRNGEEKEVYEPKGYYNSLKAAVKAVGKLCRKDLLSKQDYELDEAIKTLQTADDVLESVLYRALGEK